jgi:hypothetical protein
LTAKHDCRNHCDLSKIGAGAALSIMTATSTASLRPRADDLFGHPRALAFLFTTEMWERFSYYGMRALLVLYMVKYLLHQGQIEHVIGIASLRHFLESMFGPLGMQPFSSHIYGLYTGLVYLTPFFGGLLADRVLGQHRTVIVGAALMAAGHFMMAFESLFLFALLLLILGNGAFKPNIRAGWHSLCTGRPAPRPRLFDFLRRHQCWGISGAPRLRHARRRAGLALWFCRGRCGHDHCACDLRVRPPLAAAR